MEHGLTLAPLVAMAVTLFVWSLVSDRCERWNVSGPMVFVAVGLLLANEPFDLVDIGLGSEGVRELAEITLAVVLFGDAARVSLRTVLRDAALPGRLLLGGLPLTIALGTVVAKLAFPDLSWWLCAVIGAAVAPTDAALGAAIIEDRRVPSRIRRVLNIESGLNDGIATPFVNFFIVAAVVGTPWEETSEVGAVAALAFGVVVGAVIGGGGAWLLRQARARGLGGTTGRHVAVAALAVVSYTVALELQANGFVAAFVAGLAYGAATRADAVEESLSFTHDAAELLSFAVWFLFGALIVPVLTDAGWAEIAFAALALTVVRMLPVALALIGTGFDRATVGVIGWFGPRGLASVVFALLAYGELEPDSAREVVRAITATVVLSVVLHGATAAPIAVRYGARHSDEHL